MWVQWFIKSDRFKLLYRTGLTIPETNPTIVDTTWDLSADTMMCVSLQILQAAENKGSFWSFDAWRLQIKVQVETATSALMYRAVSVQFNASREALWWVENVNFMPYRLWLKSLMDTCLEHDRLISVFIMLFVHLCLSVPCLQQEWQEKKWKRHAQDETWDL